MGLPVFAGAGGWSVKVLRGSASHAPYECPIAQASHYLPSLAQLLVIYLIFPESSTPFGQGGGGRHVGALSQSRKEEKQIKLVG
jgi:hypothetical protein